MNRQAGYASNGDHAARSQAGRAQPAVQLRDAERARARTEKREQTEVVRGGRGRSIAVHESVHNGQYTLWGQRSTDLCEQLDDLVGREMVHQVETKDDVVRAAEFCRERVLGAV